MKQIFIDASSLSKSACVLRFYNTVVKGYKSKDPNINIIYGIAFHKFAEVLEKTGDMTKAVLEAQEYFKSKIKQDTILTKRKDHLNINHLTMVCINFFNQFYSTDRFKCVRVDDKPLVELKFAIPFYASENYEFIVSGTIDRICDAQNGLFVICDYKTTSAWDAKSYFESYRLSGQLRMYNWALRWYAKQYPDSIFSKMTNVACCIDGIFIKKEPQDCTFIRSPGMYVTSEEVIEYEDLVRGQIHKLAAYLETGNKFERTGISNGTCTANKFGSCEYFSACAAPDDKAREFFYKNYFDAEPYNPLKFNE